MILGIGFDLADILRFEKFLKNGGGFVAKLLTEKETDVFLKFKNDKRRIEWLAGRFCAKEATIKALGFGIGTISFHDIEIIANNNGKPNIHINDKIFDNLPSIRIHLTITHTPLTAGALVIVEKTT